MKIQRRWAGRSQRLWMNFGKAEIFAFTTNPANALTIYLTGRPSHPRCQGEQPLEVRWRADYWEDRQASLPCILTSFVDRLRASEGTGQRLVFRMDPLAQRYQRETFTNPEGWGFSDSHVTPPISSWRDETRQVEGKIHRAEVPGWFLHSGEPPTPPSETLRAKRKLEKVLASWDESQHTRAPPSLWPPGSSASGWHSYSFIFIKLAGLLYLPSEFSRVSF